MTSEGSHATLITSPAWGSSTNSSVGRVTAIGQVVDRATYKPGWTLELRESFSFGSAQAPLVPETALTIRVQTVDSDDPERAFTVVHYFAGPPPGVAADEEASSAWLLGMIMMVERHEAREFFRVDGLRADPPGHGPGEDPYG